VKDTDPEREETDREQDNQGEDQEPSWAARNDLGRGEGRVPGPPGEGRVARPQFRVGRSKSAVHLVEDYLLATREDHVASRGTCAPLRPRLQSRDTITIA
jgi:hypothetical protein